LVDREQFSAMQQLKNEYQANGLPHDFLTTEQFRQDLEHHLSMLLNKKQYQTNSPVVPAVAEKYDELYLSDDAKELLLECSKDTSGRIINMEFIGGMRTLSTNSRGFLTDDSHQTKARWIGALEELESRGLIKKLDFSSDYYEITRGGYTFAEAMGRKPSQSGR